MMVQPFPFVAGHRIEVTQGRQVTHHGCGRKRFAYQLISGTRDRSWRDFIDEDIAQEVLPTLELVVLTLPGIARFGRQNIAAVALDRVCQAISRQCAR
jgi:hypothetical protein